jgi:hypothetical protein
MSASEWITPLLHHAYQTARLAVTFLVFHVASLVWSDGCMRQKSTHLKVNFLLICFQQLFAPDIATQRVPLAG